MEWIMIKLRVGQETFCKWVGAAACFISSKQEAAKEPFAGNGLLGCRPLIRSALSCFNPAEGRVPSPQWGVEIRLGSPVSGATKIHWCSTLRPSCT